MRDLVFDADHLPELLGQYFDPTGVNRGYGAFAPSDAFSRPLAVALNQILADWRTCISTDTLPSSLVVISTFAFIELGRKWDQMVDGRFSPSQCRAFTAQPPTWVSIAPLDEDLLPSYCDVPQAVTLGNGDTVPIEWTDAVHVATVLSREESTLLISGDQRLSCIPDIAHRVMT